MRQNPCKRLASVTNVFAINLNCLRILYENVKNMISLRSLGACSLFLQQLKIFTECFQMLLNASEFLAINVNLLKIAFERAFAREIRYMGGQYYFGGMKVY